MKHKLRNNQLLAINTSIENDFSSGIHYHATGCGKSWIAMHILMEFNITYPKKNIIWICERKNILDEQFSQDTISDRNFKDILAKFNVLNFSKIKISKWYDSLNSAKFWNKPYLCIINRSFLTSQNKYKLIRNTIDLVIHDECHTIENKSSGDFYNWLINTNKKLKIEHRVIGFSATPEKIYPLDKILSRYSIYNGFKDSVILPPKIVWIKSDKRLLDRDIIELSKKEIKKLPYKKIIIWCGIIDECIKQAKLWSNYFIGYDICIDFTNISNKNISNYKNYEHFYNCDREALLFCAVKHREGSDIPNLDGCIFLDRVELRSDRVFIQCMGRVLRKDSLNKKKYGLVIDLKAKSTIEICNRVNRYLNLVKVFPWKYFYEEVNISEIKYFVNYLTMCKTLKIKDNEDIFTNKYTKQDIINNFSRSLPICDKYLIRLNFELDMLESKDLFSDLFCALDILKLTKNIPHVTRGSCGSSLVCYLLGISHVDPIKYKISFSRFLNSYRDTLPDIDFDFPHNLRDEVFLKLYQKWGNKVARISNHIYYHEKSALRESIRRNGIHKFISKYEIHEELSSYDIDLRNRIEKTQRELVGKFKGYSLHCGGIIYFPKGIPNDLYIKKKRNTIINQVSINKDEVSSNKNFKIDILSSRALTQLYHCNDLNTINYDLHIGDNKTIELLSNGDNIGLTLAETPLMRRALILIKPTNILELAVCLSIIRPAAKNTKKNFELGHYSDNNIIFDDDVIQIFSKLLGCDEQLGDKLRRGLSKDSNESIRILNRLLQNKTDKVKKKIREITLDISKYGFCKAHAISYAQLVWNLAYYKANHPKKFWKSTLKNINSCYQKWVHIYEAKCSGVYNNDILDKSIYANKNNLDQLGNLDKIRKYGNWDDTDIFLKDCYYINKNDTIIFCGLIAFSKYIYYNGNKVLSLYISVNKQIYLDVIVEGTDIKFNNTKLSVKGKGILLKNNLICKSLDLMFN